MCPPEAFERACSHFPSGLAVVSGHDGQHGQFAFTLSKFLPVSSDPPLVALCLPQPAPLARCPEFWISILREDQMQLARQLDHSTESPVAGAAQLRCQLERTIEAGDHSLLLARVLSVAIAGGPPLVSWKRTLFGLRLEYPFLAGAAALDQFVRDWESGALPKSAWTHCAHVVVTAFYAFNCGPEALFSTIERGIRHFNNCSGVINGPDGGYHESLTRFWAQIISDFVSSRNFESRLEAARETAAVFGEDRDLFKLYYSFDVVRDQRARREWIPPDRTPLPEWLHSYRSATIGSTFEARRAGA